ncbi:MAG TPA: carboxypeptidase regulatory-like domain-containing protein [Bryobacteraceae bacterium]|nr:carboxypeptidase regulatory-like domain-containing protein [Bryobacteraceae bacterium]
MISGSAPRSFLLLALLARASFAQTASLSGRVFDQSGAVVPRATVTIAGPSGTKTSRSGADGAYSFSALTPGAWTLNAAATRLATPQPQSLNLIAGANQLDVQLRVVAEAQQVDVAAADTGRVSTDPSANAGALVLQGQDLDALSDDPEDLVADLQALAGPSAGPSGGAIFVDGFSGGQLPPKQSIREIRINSNPFTPEYDKLGYGRIEIFTKPGSDRFHGSVGYNLGTDWWNSRNPYAGQKAPFLLQETENSFSGPLAKHSSFTLDFERQAVDNGSITNAVILDPTSFQPTPFSSVLKTPQRHWLVGPHVDWQLGEKNTLSARYLFTRAAIDDAGIGSLDLISRGYHQLITFNTAQVIENSVHGNFVNEARFQYFRSTLGTDANTTDPVIQVLGSFNGGGASAPHNADNQSSYEFQNYGSLLHGRHFWRFGVRLRAQTDDSYSTTNFNGTYTFGGGLGPELDSSNNIILDPSGNPVLIPLSSIEQYRRALVFGSQSALYGGLPTQFMQTLGQPDVRVHQFDIAPFIGDDWRIHPNLTLSLGLRYEWQTNISDWRDFAPRAAVAWAPGAKGAKPGKTVVRGGFGMFYDRFPLADTLLAHRYDGVTQHQFVVTHPTFFPAIPPPSTLVQASNQSVQRVDSNMRAPYIMQSAITVERQLPANTTLAVTYTNSHGLHLFRSRNINSPLLGTYNPLVPGSGVYPYPAQGPILLMESTGRYNQNQLIFNVNSKINPAVSVFSYYVLNKAMSDTDGINTYPGNPYDFSGEYGRAATDVRHHFLVGGTINLRWDIRLNPLFDIRSGVPFNITSGQDIYGTTLFTARPALTNDPTGVGVISTPYGLLNPYPTAGEPVIARNYGQSPLQIAFNLRIAKTWGFGPEKGSGGSGVASRDNRQASGAGLGPPPGNRGLFTQPSTARRYNLTVGMSGRNILNHNNPGPLIGNITSPLFGQATAIAGTPNGEGFLETANNRRLELQIRFTY